MKPAVITSRKAEDHFNDIISQHADIVKGYALQAQKVENYNQQKQAELQSQNSMKMEIEKTKMTNNTQVAKNADDFAIKQAELDVKRAALSTV